MIRVAQADLDAAHEMWMLSLNYGSRLSIAEVCAKHREDAYIEERAKIVAWLRGGKHAYRYFLEANRIEAGEHLK